MGRYNLRRAEELLLRVLERDARSQLSVVGRRHRISQQQLSYSLGALERKGILHSLYTVIDYSKLNVLNFRVYFRVNYIAEARMKQLLSALNREPHTSFIASCGGRYDLICTFLAENPSQFNKTLRSIIAAFPEQLQNYTVLTTVVNRYFGRKYLLKDQPVEEIYGGDRKAEALDATDLAVLAELATNARKSSVAIAKKLKVTPKTVINRMRSLEKRRVIRCYRPLIDMEKLGGALSLLTIRYLNSPAEAQDELVKALKVHPRVVWITKTFGEWDIELAVETDSEQQLRKLERELRERFAQLIQTMDRIPIYQVHKLTYFPAFLA
ncbi:Lrp/AsnC family transcriptional regulator [Candidatus Woesearchaeota archaeon]|nr:MAG: Lrp/AsnC family transcriptional regulator [Candidatus Woesearchaeota archaeon]